MNTRNNPVNEVPFKDPSRPSRCTWSVMAGRRLAKKGPRGRGDMTPKFCPVTHRPLESNGSVSSHDKNGLDQTDLNEALADCPHNFRPLEIHDRMMPLDNILDMVGQTPIVRLNRIPAEHGIKCQVYAKCEFYNAGGSVKDRIACRMLEEAERLGQAIPGVTTLIEPTSGNTGIGIALACAVKGYRVIIVLPEKMSYEKVNLLRLLGAEVIRTPTSASYDAPQSNIRVAQALAQKIPNSLILDQYMNPGNPLAHYDGTAEEIIHSAIELGGLNLSAVVLGAGTGGTVCGIGRKIKERSPDTKVVACDPVGSLLAQPSELNSNVGSFYEVEGIGYDFLPCVLDRSVVDYWVKTSDRESILMARNLVAKEGFLCGMSSGSAMYGAIKAIKELGLADQPDKAVVVILPDSIRNYMSKFVNDTWMIERNLFDASKPYQAHQSAFCQLSGLDKPFYWDESVSDLCTVLGVDGRVISVAPTDSCKHVVDKMKQGGYDQLPVTDLTSGALLGMVTVQHVMAKVAGGFATMNDEVGPIVISAFPKINRGQNIGYLVQLLRNSQFVAVVDSIPTDAISDADSGCECELTIVAILTHIDILNYVSAVGKLDK